MKVSELMDKIKNLNPDDDVDLAQSPPDPLPPPPDDHQAERPQGVVMSEDQFTRLVDMVKSSLQNSRTDEREVKDEEIYI